MSKTKKRLIISFTIIGAFIVLMIVFGAFFSLKNIYVDYATSTFRIEEYSKEDIIKTSGIKKGKNVLFMSFSKASAKLEKTFPYAKFEFVRTFPNKLTIYMSERTPVFRVLVNGRWQIYDRDLKLLEEVEPSNLEENNNDKVPVLSGKTLDYAASVGDTISDVLFQTQYCEIVDGIVYGIKAPLSIVSDIAFNYNADTNIEEFTLTMRDSGAKILIQDENYLYEKVAYGVDIYLEKVSQNSEHVGHLDKILIRVLRNFDPNATDDGGETGNKRVSVYCSECAQAE